ncbi:hypothetical protein NP233_g4122 [Leucocoprinus birnbaumii]|uniref:Clavaminate synthase-like protein n=1 Tax=Leucocoprinus birnbaumii TaxID=56174 RepID=A0AAD5VWP0_9AGAR|nr:hypothetical protein NP233_g4122 [Leucocoprinus birnbaumii]
MARQLLSRTVATLTRQVQPITRTAEGAVAISYPTLVSTPLSLGDAIADAETLHMPLQMKHLDLIPDHVVAEHRFLLKWVCDDEGNYEWEARSAGSLFYDKLSATKAYVFPVIDTLKGSYYANPVVDKPRPDRNEKGIEGFEDAFKDLGRFVFNVGCQLAAACQPFALSHLSDSSISLPELISTSQTTKARLLHYFPPPPGEAQAKEDEPVDSWCGFHLDHSLLTGLCSAMFLRKQPGGEPEIVSSPSPSSGLYIRTRGGDLNKVSIPADCLAFQTGEALEVATGGKLRATPHCVRVGATGPDAVNISRQTLALFMQPNTNQFLSPTTTFGQFSKRVFDEHYGAETM